MSEHRLNPMLFIVCVLCFGVVFLSPARSELIFSVRSIPKSIDFTIQFEFGTHQLAGHASEQLDELAELLKTTEHSQEVFSVQGYANSTEDPQDDRSLSLQRAQAVVRRLVESGISPRRLIEVGLGDEYPFPGSSWTDPRNQRVKIVRLGTMATMTGDPNVTEDQKRRRRALLIGIDEYEHVDDLPSSVNDAMAMKSFISDFMGYNDSDIRMLLNAEATRKNILDAFEGLISETDEGDEVFFFFSGHAYFQPDKDGDEADGKDEILITADSEVSKSEHNDDQVLSSDPITDDEMEDLLSRLSGRSLHIVIDACYSDGFRLAASAAAGAPAGKVPPVAIWTSASDGQQSLVDRNPREDGELMSVYTRRLLWGVRDREADSNGDGVVTRSELHDYVLSQSKAYCEGDAADDCRAGLTPQFEGTLKPDQPAFEIAPPPSLTRNILFQQAERIVEIATVDFGFQVKTDKAEEEIKTRVRLSIEAEDNWINIETEDGIKIGRSSDIVVESSMDGHLVLLDIDPSGNLTQIFPNEFSLSNSVSNYVREGKALRLPMERLVGRADPPSETGRLLAVVSKQGNSQLRHLARSHGDLAAVSRPNAYLAELAEALRYRANDGEPVPPTAATILDYEVVEREIVERSISVIGGHEVIRR